MAYKKKKLPKALLVSLGIPTIFVPGLILASLLGWDWQEGLETLEDKGGYTKSKEIYPTKTTVVAVYDGDTIEIDNGLTLRLLGINAPNRGEEGWIEADEYLEDLVLGEKVEIEYDTYQVDKYGRLLGYVWEECTTSLGCVNGKRLVNFVLIKKGYATVETYNDRRPLKYETLLKEAEKN